MTTFEIPCVKKLKTGTGSVRYEHEQGPPCVCELLVEGGDRAGGAVCNCNPWNPKWGECPIAEYEVMIVHGDNGHDYELKMPRTGGIYCSCPAWKWRTHSEYPAQCRICKHGAKLLTDAFGAKGNRIAMEWQAQGMQRLGDDYVIKRERPEEIARKEREQQEKLEAMKLPRVTQPYSPQPAGLPTPTAPEDGSILAEWDIALANDRSGKEPVLEYAWSEKLDGVRAYFNGSNCFGSKTGRPVNVPPEIIRRMPKGLSLDGELYANKDVPLSKISGLLRRKNPKVEDWDAMGIKFYVFDSPFVQGDFFSRMDAVKQAVGPDHPFVRIVDYRCVESEEQLQRDFERIVNAGGEGVMLRLIRGVYRAGRTSDLLKLKDVQYEEAMVIGDNLPTTDSIVCKLRSGKTFSLSCDGARHPPVGRVVTVKYKCLTPAGVPREPKYVGLCRRIDVDAAQFE